MKLKRNIINKLIKKTKKTKKTCTVDQKLPHQPSCVISKFKSSIEKMGKTDFPSCSSINRIFKSPCASANTK